MKQGKLLFSKFIIGFKDKESFFRLNVFNSNKHSQNTMSLLDVKSDNAEYGWYVRKSH